MTMTATMRRRQRQTGTRSDVSRRFRGGKISRGNLPPLSFPCRCHPLPPLEIQISRFTRPNGILPFSREHLPEYAPQSLESRSIRSASRELAGNEDRGGMMLANTKIKAHCCFLLFHPHLPPSFSYPFWRTRCDRIVRFEQKMSSI